MDNTVILLLLFSTAEPILSLRGVVPEKLTCELNPSECSDIICNMTKLDQLKVIVSIGCKLQRPQPKLSARMQVFKKIKPNKYIPALFDFTIDMCSNTLENNEVFSAILPGIKEQIEKFTHECPYSVIERITRHESLTQI
jgi:Protein of unknown function (DUF1091)